MHSVTDLPDQLSTKVVVAGSGCWEWTAHLNNYGYGVVMWRSQRTLAHRLTFHLLVDPSLLPRRGTDERQIDHLCRNRACVNPDHLEAVTALENVRRSHAARRRPRVLSAQPITPSFEEERHEVRDSLVSAITATFKRKLKGFHGDDRLYELSEPVEYEDGATSFVVVSGVDGAYACETYIFHADEKGKIIDWAELDGSFQGDVDHNTAITDAGWVLA